MDLVKLTMTKEEAQQYFHMDADKRHILLMPGSRKQEVLGLWTACSAQRNSCRPRMATWISVAAGTDHRQGRTEAIINKISVKVTITEDKTYDLMQVCHSQTPLPAWLPWKRH